MLQLPEGTTLCHGIGLASVKGQEGWEIAHAWNEFEGRAYDSIWMIHGPSDWYRAQLRISYVVEYNYAEALSRWIITEAPGPWDEKIRAVIEGNRDKAAKWRAEHGQSSV